MHPEFESATIAGGSVRYICCGHGAPAVVIDQGAGLSVEQGLLRPHLLGWPRVLREVQKTTRVLMHDRAGLGFSDEPRTPRASSDMVAALRTVLRRAEVPPPYILVGHSIGGLNVRVFASRYPREVAGVLLVDASHPDQWERIADVVPSLGAIEPGLARRLRAGPGSSISIEKIDFMTSAHEARASGELGDTPLIVLTRSPHAIIPHLGAAASERLGRVWSELQRELLGLSRRSTHIIASQAGHNIQLDEPQLVIDAIARLLDTARAGRSTLH